MWVTHSGILATRRPAVTTKATEIEWDVLTGNRSHLCAGAHGAATARWSVAITMFHVKQDGGVPYATAKHLPCLSARIAVRRPRDGPFHKPAAAKRIVSQQTKNNADRQPPKVATTIMADLWRVRLVLLPDRWPWSTTKKWPPPEAGATFGRPRTGRLQIPSRRTAWAGRRSRCP